MNSLNFQKLISTIALLVISNASFGQKLEPRERKVEPDHTISSKIMGKDYQLYISFPSSYSAEDTISYPVLYVMDGMRDFQIFRVANTVLGFAGEIDEVIVVGISSGLDIPSFLITRSFDLTPAVDTVVERMSDEIWGLPRGTIKTGGAGKFYKCLKTEIVPFIDEHYKTNTDRGISGHSFGGLFVAYCLLNSDGYFTRFAINSPSLYWNNNEVLDRGIKKFTTEKTWDIPPTKIYISMGGEESARLVSKAVKFSSYLEEANYENVDLSWQIFDHESHVSVIPASLSRTLSVLYGKK